jgi:nucleotidyltransferase/DNA polymerase involved in DNA repair
VRVWPVCASDAGASSDGGRMERITQLVPELRRARQIWRWRCAAVCGRAWEGVGLVMSVGVGRSKLVARMLSPLAQPDGVLAARLAL